MVFKKVLTYSPTEKKVRLFRLAWMRVPNFYFKRRLSVNLRPRLFEFWRECDSWFLTALCLQFHMKYDSNGSMPE